MRWRENCWNGGIHVDEREALRLRIKSDMKAFTKGGGRIQRLAYGQRRPSDIDFRGVPKSKGGSVGISLKKGQGKH